MTDNLDELKRQWQLLSPRLDDLEETNRRLSEKLAKNKVTSLQESLAERIRRWAGVGFLLPVLAPMLHTALDLPWWICVAYAVFGLIMSFMSFRFVKFIKTDRLIDLPVSDAILRASEIKKRQMRIWIIGCLLGTVLLFSIVSLLPDRDRPWMIVGLLTGIVIGLGIGLPRAIKNHRLAKQLVESLKENS